MNPLTFRLFSAPPGGVPLALGLVTLLASLGISIIAVALPALSVALAAPLAAVRWIMLAYLVTLTASVLVAGRLADLFGPRRVLLIGLLLFAAAASLAPLAPSLILLIACRAVQGAGAAVLIALPPALLQAHVPPDRMGRAMGWTGTMSAIGTAAGPSLGGVLVGVFGWQAPFAAMALAAGLIALVTLSVLPDDAVSRRDPASRFDAAGAALLMLALGLAALAMAGTPLPLEGGPLILPLLAVLALTLFVLQQRRTAHPLLDLAALADAATAPLLTVNLLVAAVMMATLVIGPFALADGLSLPPAMIGLVMAIGPVLSALSGAPAGRAVDRFGAFPILGAGLVAMAAGLAALALLPRHVGAVGYAAALFLLTPGYQMVLAACGTALMAGADGARRGEMAGLMGLSRNLGFMAGASIIATIFVLAGGAAQTGDPASPARTLDAMTITFLIAAAAIAAALGLVRLIPQNAPHAARHASTKPAPGVKPGQTITKGPDPMSGDDDYVYDEASGEWLPASELAAKAAAAAVVTDSAGNVLADGDQVTLIKDLKVKGTSTTLKQGTVIRSIRLTDNPEEIDCRHDGIKGLVLRTEFVRKR